MGIWIAIDLIIGTALGCGGFVTAFLVYILNRGQYHPMVRAALMTSLFGYSLGGLAVMFDLGRWWQGYNIMLPWLFNTNSVLLETALCIFCYILVLLVEFAPAFLERFGLRESRRQLNRILFIFTGLGVLLPMMHQSSMGTVVVLLGYKLSPLWQSQLLTVTFLVTAVTMGIGIVMFESLLSSVAFRRPFETSILKGLAGIAASTALAFLLLRIFDVSRLAAWPAAFAGTSSRCPSGSRCRWASPPSRCLPKGGRGSPRNLFLGSSAILLNGALYRLNCYLVGYDPGDGWSLLPIAGGDPGDAGHLRHARRPLSHLRQAPAGAARGAGRWPRLNNRAENHGRTSSHAHHHRSRSPASKAICASTARSTTARSPIPGRRGRCGAASR